MHQVGIDVAELRMIERLGQDGQCSKAKPLIELDGRLVGADHEIELDRFVAGVFGLLERMRRQHAADARNVWAAVPRAIRATANAGAIQVFAGCYVLHHTNPGIDPRPDAALWKLNQASISVAPANVTPAQLIAGLDCSATP